MFGRHGAIALAMATLVTTYGCASAPRSPGWAGTLGAGEDIRITVDNKAYLDMVIYSEITGSRVRLGEVAGGFRATFKLPRHQMMASTIRLIADPIGSPRPYVSEPVSANPGQEIRWTVHEGRGLRALSVW